jgi:tetratricopeptide (TPR) repeat protein
MTQGNIYKHWKKNPEAHAKYLDVLKVDPDNIEVQFNLGDVAFYSGRFQDAFSHYSKFFENFVKYVETIQIKNSKFDVEAFYGELLFKRCQCVLATEDWEFAIKQYNHLIEYLLQINSPSLSLAYNKRGYAYFRTHQWQKCVDDNTRALEVDPKCIEAYRDRMEAYDILGMRSESDEDKRSYEFLLRKKLTIKK